METNKKSVFSIVISIVSFVLILLFFIGLLALPAAQEGPFNQPRIYDFFAKFIAAIEQMQQSGVQAGLVALLSSMTAVVFALVFGIIGIVLSIILLVKSIQRLSGKIDDAAHKAILVKFGVNAILYIALLSGTLSGTQTLSIGSEMILSVAILALTGAGLYHIVSKDDRRLVNKILGLATSLAAIVGMILIFMAPVITQANEAHGIFASLANVLGSAINGNEQMMISAIMFIFGAAITIVGFCFAKGVLKNGFTLEYSKRPELDYPKSSIVKSSLWLGFALVGLLLMFIPLASVSGYGIGVASIIGIVFACAALALSIVNKALSRKAA